jgi:hypothetical protein
MKTNISKLLVWQSCGGLFSARQGGGGLGRQTQNFSRGTSDKTSSPPRKVEFRGLLSEDYTQATTVNQSNQAIKQIFFTLISAVVG